MDPLPIILHLVTDLRVGGTQIMLLERIRRSRRFRHAVLVFAPHTGRGRPRHPVGNGPLPPDRRNSFDGGQGDLWAEFEREGIPLLSLDLVTSGQAVGAWITGSRVGRIDALVRDLRPRAVHSTLFHTHVLADWIARRHGLPHIAGKEGIDSWMGPAHRFLECRSLNRATRIAAVSRAAAAAVTGLGVRSAGIRIIPNGIDRDAPGNWEIPVACSKGGPHLLGVGRLEAAKGWGDLIEAVARLGGEFPEMVLHLRGSGHEEDALRGLARRLAISNRVRFLGQDGVASAEAARAGRTVGAADAAGTVGPEEAARATGTAGAAHTAGAAGTAGTSRTAHIEATADSPHASQNPTEHPASLASAAEPPVLVVPSREEGFGLVLLEGMARGLPIIATDAGGIPEVARHEREALLVSPANPRELAGAIARILREPELRRRLTAAGSERVAAFPIAGMVLAYEALYDSVLGEETRPR